MGFLPSLPALPALSPGAISARSEGRFDVYPLYIRASARRRHLRLALMP